MAKVAVLVPYQEMCDLVNRMIGRYGSIQPMCVEYIRSNRLEDRARELEQLGCELIVARGRYAKLAKHCVKLPVVEIRVTAQELGALVVELREELGVERPRIGLAGFANMLCDTAQFDELFGVELLRYPVVLESGAQSANQANTSEALRAAVARAAADGCRAVIGGDVVCARAGELGLACRFIPSGRESIQSALDIADRVCYAIDLEKSDRAEMDAMLSFTFNGIMQVDANGVVHRANRAMFELLRCRPRDVLGRSALSIFPELGADALNAALIEGKESFNILLPVQRKRAVVNIAPIRIDQEITGAILTFQEGQRILEMDEELRRDLYLQGYVARHRFDEIPAESPESRRTLELASRMARYGAPVLLTGEAGCGKHILAECIHNASAAQGNAYIPLDCGAHHPDTLDTMLFGNYTTRKDTAACLAEIAEGGTIYLAHVEALSAELQYKLLNLIRGSFVHNGSNRPSAAKVRVIASTDGSLVARVERGEFRSDLYYALNVLGIQLTPLRQRREDILGWVEFYLKEWQERYKRYVNLTQGAKSYLRSCDWPGNLNQVDSICERIVLLTERRNVDESFLKRQMEQVAPKVVSDAGQVVLFKDRKAVEISELLKKHNGNRQRVADELGVSKTTLWRYMKKYGIEKDFSY